MTDRRNQKKPPNSKMSKSNMVFIKKGIQPSEICWKKSAKIRENLKKDVKIKKGFYSYLHI